MLDNVQSCIMHSCCNAFVPALSMIKTHLADTSSSSFAIFLYHVPNPAQKDMACCRVNMMAHTACYGLLIHCRRPKDDMYFMIGQHRLWCCRCNTTRKLRRLQLYSTCHRHAMQAVRQKACQLHSRQLANQASHGVCCLYAGFGNIQWQHC